MAMTKKEREAFAELKKELRLVAALRWTEPVLRDVPPPYGGAAKYSEGFTFGAYSVTVEQAWSTAVAHGKGPAPEGRELYRSGSQGARSLFSTRRKALQALRHEIELESAAKLAKVDQMLEEDANGWGDV